MKGCNAEDFRQIALSLEGVEEGTHMGVADFRVGGKIFATLASIHKGYGNLMLTPGIQDDFIQEAPGMYLPVTGGWGKNGVTHIRLAEVGRDVLEAALRCAWRVRLEKNKKDKG